MCLYPVVIKTKDAFGITVSQSVPCGKCIECLKDKQNSWKIRLTEESRDHLYVYFFTLTYNDDSAPYVYDEEGSKVLQLNKNHVQLWIKRLRMRYERKFGRKIDFKYFVCGEYGPNTGRPHYHGIFFTNDIIPIYARQMFSDWEQMYGYTIWSDVGKKKAKNEVVFQLSEIMLQNTVQNLSNSELKQSFVLTDLFKLELYNLPFTSCLRALDLATFSE